MSIVPILPTPPIGRSPVTPCNDSRRSAVFSVTVLNVDRSAVELMDQLTPRHPSHHRAYLESERTSLSMSTHVASASTSLRLLICDAFFCVSSALVGVNIDWMERLL